MSFIASPSFIILTIFYCVPSTADMPNNNLAEMIGHSVSLFGFEVENFNGGQSD